MGGNPMLWFGVTSTEIFFRRGKIAFYNKIYGKHAWFNALKEFYTSELPAKNVRFQVRAHWQLSSRKKYVSSNHFYNTEVKYLTHLLSI